MNDFIYIFFGKNEINSVIKCERMCCNVGECVVVLQPRPLCYISALVMLIMIQLIELGVMYNYRRNLPLNSYIIQIAKKLKLKT